MTPAGTAHTVRESRTRASSASGANRGRAPGRALVAGSGLVVRRRLGRDLVLLLVLGALVAVSTAAALAGPRAAQRTLEDGLRQAVVESPGAGRVDLVGDLGPPEPGVYTARVRPQELWEYAAEARERVPAPLGDLVAGAAASVVTPGNPIDTVDGEAPTGPASRADLQLAAVGDLSGHVTVVQGRLPEVPERGWRPFADDEPPLEVVLPAAAAERLGLAPGALLGTPDVDASMWTNGTLELEVVGTVEPVDPATPVWEHLADPWDDDPSGRGVTALVAEGSMDAYQQWSLRAMSGRVSLLLDPDALTPASAPVVLDQLRRAEAEPGSLATGVEGDVALDTGLTATLTRHLDASRAAVAQMSVPQAGVAVVGALVLVLLARLVVAARAGVLALERARGASVASSGLRLLAESALVTTVGVAVGAGLAHLVVPGTSTSAVWSTGATAVAVVALLAAPVLGAREARRAWAGRRDPADRRERAARARHRGLRRAVAGLGVLLVAAAAVLALRSRGLVAEADGTADPLLALAPALLAAAAAVVVVRVHPLLVRPFAALGRRSTGALGVVGATRATGAVAPLPLLALVVGSAVAVSGVVVVDTVRAGQVQASWDRVGADVRVEGGAAVELVAAGVTEAPGVTHAAAAAVVPETTLDVGSRTTTVTLLGVDEHYADLLAAVPGAGDDLDALARLAGSERGSDGALPAVVDVEVAELLTEVEPGVVFRGRFHHLQVVGTTDHRPVGQLPGPFVLVDLTALGDGVAPDPTTLWLLGDGAAEAVRASEVADHGVTTRADWLAERRGLEHLAGVERLWAASVVVVLVLAGVALVATVVGGARERGRTLALLRTLGMRARSGWWLALAEVLPLLVTGLLAGAAVGVLAVGLLGGALGLDLLTGGVGPPPPVVAPEVLVGLGGGAVVLVLVAVLTEVAVHRHERLADVLRAGETS